MIHPSWCFLFQLLFTSSPFLACSRLTLPWTTADLTSGFSTIVINGRTHFDLGSVMEPRRCCPLRWLCYFHRSNPLDIALAKVSMIAMATTANGTWLAWIWFTLCKAYEPWIGSSKTIGLQSTNILAAPMPGWSPHAGYNVDPWMGIELDYGGPSAEKINAYIH